MPTWQPGTRTHGGEQSLSPACYLPFFLFRTDKHAGREIARRHMAAWPHVLENQLPDSLLTAQEGVCLQGGLLAWEWMQGFDFHTWDPPPIFSVLLGLVCVTAPSFLFDLHLFFLFSWMCARGFDSGPDHMTALASNTGVCGRIGRGPRYSIWPSHWWNSIYLRLENVMAVNRTPLKILFVLYLGQIKLPNCKSESLSY